jgi:hypothetical protein
MINSSIELVLRFGFFRLKWQTIQWLTTRDTRSSRIKITGDRDRQIENDRDRERKIERVSQKDKERE